MSLTQKQVESLARCFALKMPPITRKREHLLWMGMMQAVSHCGVDPRLSDAFEFACLSGGKWNEDHKVPLRNRIDKAQLRTYIADGVSREDMAILFGVHRLSVGRAIRELDLLDDVG